MYITPGSIYDYLTRTPGYSKFLTIVKRAAMISQLNNAQSDCTLFVPSDSYLRHIPPEYFENMDDGLARQILACSTVNYRINRELITSSPVAYYFTRNAQMRMFVTNIGGKTNINNCASIVKYDIVCNNGLVHLVDGLVAPNNDTFMN